MLINILEYDRTEIQAYLTAQAEPAYRAQQIHQGIYIKKYERFEQFSNLPKTLRNRLAGTFRLRTFQLLDTIRSPLDKTTKFLWQLPDGLKIESVIIYEKRRVTFCISSQVGCPLDCKFCATGKMGFLRNLTVAEIVEQVLQMIALSERPPTNIVYMGMGEPMLNYENVMKAAHILSDPEGLCFSRKKITISTGGITPGIYRMADEASPYALAVSLNAVTQTLREQLMPIASKYPLDDLLKAALYYTKKTKKRITFEYVLMDRFNASQEDARNLVRITSGIPCKINIIPCNSEDELYRPPSAEAIDRFDQLANTGRRAVTIRNRKGWEIRAACGQLYAANEKGRTQMAIKKMKF